MELPPRRPPTPRASVKMSHTPAHPVTTADGRQTGSVVLAAGAVAGACYLLLILALRESSSVFSAALWKLGVAFILTVPTAAGAGLALGWRGLFVRRFRWKNASVFALASVALLLYTAFWVIARMMD